MKTPDRWVVLLVPFNGTDQLVLTCTSPSVPGDRPPEVTFPKLAISAWPPFSCLHRQIAAGRGDGRDSLLQSACKNASSASLLQNGPHHYG